MAYMTNLDILALGKLQGKVQMVDAIVGIPTMLDMYQYNSESKMLDKMEKK